MALTIEQKPLYTLNPVGQEVIFTVSDVVRYLKIRFTIEGSTTAINNVSVINTVDSVQYTLINGYLKYTDVQDRDALGNFGYDTEVFQMINGVSGQRLLSNAPLTQYANIEDYGTLSFMATPVVGDAVATTVDYIKIITYTSSGAPILIISSDNTDANGGVTTWNSDTKNQLLHFGCFPANLMWSNDFLASIPTLSYYTIEAFNSTNFSLSDTYTININCPTLKGYEPIRLTWLNQWGVWDYYTFKMKSTKMISTKGSTYQQLEGTWNESIYLPNGYKGGKKAFRVNAMEKISMNTDFVNESESEWFEELINSPEVYILEGFQVDATLSSPNTYVTPARLTTSSYTRKTVANDKLMQYTFEVEKSKTLRTQSV